MIQVNRVLHPTDFSAPSDHAARYACALADRFNAELHLLHIVASLVAALPEIDPSQSAHVDDYGELVKQLKADAERKMDELLKAVGCSIQGVVCASEEGAPFVQIIRYAKEHDIDLIVMGTHGRTGLSHMMMGSVAERVVRKATCPVLTVPPEGHDFVMP